MVDAVQREHVLAVQVGVDLGGLHRGVSEHLLHAAQVRAAFDHVRGERVTQRVGRDVHVEVGAQGRGLHAPPRVGPVERCPAVREEDLAARGGAGHAAATVLEPARQGLARALADGDEAHLAALAEQSQHAQVGLEAVRQEPAGLAHARAGRVEHFEQGAVALVLPARARGRRQQALDLVDGQGARQGMAQDRRREQARGVALDAPLRGEVAEEHAQGAQAARHARLGSSGGPAGGQVGHQEVGIDGRKAARAARGEEARRGLDVPAVGLQGGPGEPRFHPQGLEEIGQRGAVGGGERLAGHGESVGLPVRRCKRRPRCLA